MSVRYKVQGQLFVPDKPQAWSDKRLANTPTTRAYDVSPDGRSVIALLPSEDSDEDAAAHELTFLFNFPDEVRRRVAAGTLR